MGSNVKNSPKRHKVTTNYHDIGLSDNIDEPSAVVHDRHGRDTAWYKQLQHNQQTRVLLNLQSATQLRYIKQLTSQLLFVLWHETNEPDATLLKK